MQLWQGAAEASMDTAGVEFAILSSSLLALTGLMFLLYVIGLLAWIAYGGLRRVTRETRLRAPSFETSHQHTHPPLPARPIGRRRRAVVAEHRRRPVSAG